jgi:hypothetical protein
MSNLVFFLYGFHLVKVGDCGSYFFKSNINIKSFLKIIEHKALIIVKGVQE